MASNIIPPPTPSANLIDVPRTLTFETPFPASGNASHKTAQPENVLSPQFGAKHMVAEGGTVYESPMTTDRLENFQTQTASKLTIPPGLREAPEVPKSEPPSRLVTPPKW